MADAILARFDVRLREPAAMTDNQKPSGTATITNHHAERGE